MPCQNCLTGKRTSYPCRTRCWRLKPSDCKEWGIHFLLMLWAVLHVRIAWFCLFFLALGFHSNDLWSSFSNLRLRLLTNPAISTALSRVSFFAIQMTSLCTWGALFSYCYVYLSYLLTIIDHSYHIYQVWFLTCLGSESVLDSLWLFRSLHAG